jgi:AraC-like DNA-binding protein
MTKLRVCGQQMAERLADFLGTHILHNQESILKGPIPAGHLARWQERRAKELLQENLGGNIEIDDIAKACSLSSAHFSRAFSNTVGLPPHRWLVHRRVDHARHLLLQNELSLTDIAGACGFSDQSHFTRVFKRVVGISPGRWRRHSA